MESKRKRKSMKPPSEAQRGWSAALRAELEQWPSVELKNSFGMILVYRGDLIFAALSGTRAFYSEDAIMLKFNREKRELPGRIAAEPRFVPGAMHTRGQTSEGRKWRLLALREGADLNRALEWLADAYQSASPARKPR
jgi:hypothetical protein